MGHHSRCHVIALITAHMLLLMTIVAGQGMADESVTADQLLDLERKIAVQKRLIELRKLQLQQQSQDVQLFGAGPNKSGKPVVIQMPVIRLKSLRSRGGVIVAGLEYGRRFIEVHQGDSIEQGVRVQAISQDGIRINFHGSTMRFGLGGGKAGEQRSRGGVAP